MSELLRAVPHVSFSQSERVYRSQRRASFLSAARRAPKQLQRATRHATCIHNPVF